jgi:tRNA pseudouridine55 synthase
MATADASGRDAAAVRRPVVPDGVLPIDKPVGPSSHDIVAVARRALRTRRIGHTGTLDPFASGLLLLCVGQATRIAEYLSGTSKRYTATVRLGVTTDTDDHTGSSILAADTTHITTEDVQAALATLQRSRLQQPPVYSAKQRGGERAYSAARQGRVLDVAAVPITIHRLELTRFDNPFVELDVTVSAGTYIRALARDLGVALGTGAHLTVLRRTAVGAHRVEDAVSLDDLGDAAAVMAALIAPLDAISHLPRIELSDIDLVHIRHGRAIHPQAAGPAHAGAPATAAVPQDTVALAHDGVLVAIAGIDDAGTMRPKKVLLHADAAERGRD